MKKALNFILLSAGIILALTGCQKGTEAENSDRIVRFSASTGVGRGRQDRHLERQRDGSSRGDPENCGEQ